MKKLVLLAFAMLLLGCLAQRPESQTTTRQSNLPTTPAATATPSQSLTEGPRACFENGACITIEVASTEQERETGLMNRKAMPVDAGMLFVHDYPALHAYWMKNTLIPLDIAWMDENLTVVDVQQMTPCASESCPSYSPKAPALYVLETNLGVLGRNNATPGSKIRVSNATIIA